MNPEKPMHSSARSIKHSSFVIERRFDFDPAQVYRAWVDPAAKARWFNGPADKWTEILREMDVRVGGRERAIGKFTDGSESRFEAQYTSQSNFLRAAGVLGPEGPLPGRGPVLARRRPAPQRGGERENEQPGRPHGFSPSVEILLLGAARRQPAGAETGGLTPRRSRTETAHRCLRATADREAGLPSSVASPPRVTRSTCSGPTARKVRGTSFTSPGCQLPQYPRL